MASFIGYRPEEITNIDANTIVGLGVTDINYIHSQELSPSNWLSDKNTFQKPGIELNRTNRFLYPYPSWEIFNLSSGTKNIKMSGDGTKLYIDRKSVV